MESGRSVSVIAAVYNVEQYIEACVQSICRQTYKNLEILLVDDGSPDRSGELCDALAAQDSRIRVLHKANGGLSDARNAAIEVAQGDYLTFVDGDDLLHPRMIECLIQALEDEPGALMSAVTYTRFTHEEELDWEAQEPLRAQALTLDQYVRIHLWMTAWGKLYRKELFQEVRYPKGRYHEDEYVTYRLIHQSGTVAFAAVPWYGYRQREGSITDRMEKKKYRDTMDAFLERQKTAASWNDPAFSSYCGQSFALLYFLMKENGAGELKDMEQEALAKCREAFRGKMLLSDRVRIFRYMVLSAGSDVKHLYRRMSARMKGGAGH